MDAASAVVSIFAAVADLRLKVCKLLDKGIGFLKTLCNADLIVLQKHLQIYNKVALWHVVMPVTIAGIVAACNANSVQTLNPAFFMMSYTGLPRPVKSITTAFSCPASGSERYSSISLSTIAGYSVPLVGRSM